MTTQPDRAELEAPEDRRWWLLRKALDCLPLDKAIDLARAADAFVTGPSVQSQPLLHASQARLAESQAPSYQTQANDAANAAEPIVASAPERREGSLEKEGLLEIAPGTKSSPVEPASPKRTNLALSPEQRGELLQLMVEGARNADLAAKFGLSGQQVQGFRMGSAREIAARRNRLKLTKERATETPQLGSSVDEIVRYLRQQDDVVVPEGKGEFMLNGRFRLGMEELVERANRMRRRQGKPEFALADVQPREVATVKSANGHPLLWNRRLGGASSAGTASSM
jgi:hypothetical protein